MSDLIKKQILADQLSTGILDTDATPAQWNSIVSSPDTLVADVNFSGYYLLVDRTDAFFPSGRRVDWSPITGLVPPNADGNNIVLVDNAGVIQIITSDSPDLPISGGTYNQNNSLQLAVVITSGGVITSIANIISYRGSGGLRLNNVISNFLGVVNSSKNPVVVTNVGANLQLKYTAGQVLTSDIGATGDLNLDNPDTRNVVAANPALVVLTDRNSVIQSVGNDVDVTLFESAPGVFSVMPNNTHKLTFFRIVPAAGFLGYVLGQTTYATAQVAIDSGEPPEYPENLSRSANTITETVAKNETDLDNGIIRTQTRIS